jgi:hypothetical protein
VFALVAEVPLLPFSLSPLLSLSVYFMLIYIASGEVFKAQFRGTEVAVKKIIATHVDSKVIQDFEMEVAIMWYV